VKLRWTLGIVVTVVSVDLTGVGVAGQAAAAASTVS